MMLGCWPSLHSTSSSPAKSRWSFSEANSAGRSAHTASLNKVQAKQLRLLSLKWNFHISQRMHCTGITFALCLCVINVQYLHMSASACMSVCQSYLSASWWLRSFYCHPSWSWLWLPGLETVVSLTQWIKDGNRRRKYLNIHKVHEEPKHLAKVALSNDIFKLYVLPLQDWIGEGLWGWFGPPCQGQSSWVKLQNSLLTLGV